MSEIKQYFIRVNNQPIPVSEEIYRAYYQERRHERYLEEKDAYHRLVHYSAFDTWKTTGEEQIPDDETESVEDVAIRYVMAEKLQACLSLLSRGERLLVSALFFEGMTERQYAAETGIPQKTINDRKARVLAMLKKLLEIEK